MTGHGGGRWRKLNHDEEFRHEENRSIPAKP
jgi:hypothetical protein